MKKQFKILFAVLIALPLFFSACKKEAEDDPLPPVPPPPAVNYNQGLGNIPGLPVGTVYNFPPNIQLIGEIRGGHNKTLPVDKFTYNGPFPFADMAKNWITYGTGTFVNLYFQVFNMLTVPDTLTLPGGLIFVDINDTDSILPTYQRGLLLQTVNIPIDPLDTAWVHLPCYCLNLHMSVPNFNTVYTLGPVTSNPELNQLVTLMAPKQYPFGEEYNLQSIVWNITDNGDTLTPANIAYINSLP